MSISFDQSQLSFIKSDFENIRLLAPAGSGKTLSLLERCLWLSSYHKGADKPKFLVVTFTRAARDELQDRVNTDPRFLPIRSFVEISTLNKWGYDHLKQNGQKLKVIQLEGEKGSIVKTTLRPIWEQYPFKLEIENCKDKPAIIDIFDELKSAGFRHDSLYTEKQFDTQKKWVDESGLDRYFDAAVVEKLDTLNLLDNKETVLYKKMKHFLRFWAVASRFLWDSKIISLEDQKYWALITIQEKYKNAFAPAIKRYHHIMVDEFQDINPLDLQLIKELRRVNKSTLTIIGDDDQAIFEWRGANPRFILYPEIYFETKFSTYELAKNYRSPKNIVAKSQNLISHNLKRENKVFPSCSNQQDAEIIQKTYQTHIESLNYVMDLAVSAHHTKKPKQLAIVARKKSQIIPIQILLTNKGIPFYAKEDLSISLSSAFNDLKKILLIIYSKARQKLTSDIANEFITCCNYVGKYPLKTEQQASIRKFLIDAKPKTFLDALALFKNYRGSLYLSKDAYITAIRQVLDTQKVSTTIEKIGMHFKGMQKNYYRSDDDIFYKDPPFLYLSEIALQYKNDVNAFILQIEKFIEINKRNGRITQDYPEKIDGDLKYPVHIMTALRTKGKEFETVILLDVNDDIWPNRVKETPDKLELERRIFYVAITRPRKKLIFLTVKQIAGKFFPPSPYLDEIQSQYNPGLNNPDKPTSLQLQSRDTKTPNKKNDQNSPYGGVIVRLKPHNLSTIKHENQKFPKMVERKFLEVFEKKNVDRVSFLDFKNFIYKRHPEFNTLLSLNGFSDLISALKACSHIIEIVENSDNVVS